jgi:hypothetical protein
MMRTMRTTVTLDADVEALLRDAMQQRRQSFKEVLNQAIRSGLSTAPASAADTPFVVQSRPMGVRAGIDPGRLNQLADEMEAEGFADLGRRLVKDGRTRSREPR